MNECDTAGPGSLETQNVLFIFILEMCETDNTLVWLCTAGGIQ